MIRTIHGVWFSLFFVLLLYFVRVTYSNAQNMLHPRNKTAVILHSYLPKTATSATVTFLRPQAGHYGEVSLYVTFLF